jgi:hypothetical protein
MGLSMLMVFVVVVALIGVVWWLESVPPDDPWMLENQHRLSHHYADGMGPGSVDHKLQEEASKKSIERDVQLNSIWFAYTARVSRLRRIS